ncbi:NusG domain II-containing protein [uncultured Finegoldia sp.]|uniref:NusG domain II-containing protein n=1 Tax=uncultured Finegoldia sp. TaxID=328009 RepID=UPI00261009AA|nr:NusG domain II-containing protein [uncultured Finegoldia sp.]
MTKYDKILVGFLLCFSAILFVVMNIDNANSQDRYVSIQVNGKEIKQITLPVEDYNYKIDNKYGHNVVHINGYSVWISDSDCPDKLCILKGKIEKPGDVIVCLPNKLVVEVKASKQNKNDIDVVNY